MPEQREYAQHELEAMAFMLKVMEAFCIVALERAIEDPLTSSRSLRAGRMSECAPLF